MAVIKKYSQWKVKVSAKINVTKNHIFSYTTMTAKQLTQTFILTCCQLTFTVHTLALCLPSDQWFWDALTTIYDR